MASEAIPAPASLWRFYVKFEDQDAEHYRDVKFIPWMISFLRETSLQGVPQLIKQPGLFKKFFWIVAIAMCAMGLEWELATFFTKFLSWTANTAVAIQTARQLPFPAITLCNNNPVTTDWYNDVFAPPPPPISGDPSVGAFSGGNPSTGSNASALGTTAVSVTPASGSPGANTPTPSGRRKRQANLGTIPPGGNFQASGYQTQPGSSGRSPPPRPNYGSDMQKLLSIQAGACSVPYQNRSVAGHQLCDMVLAMQYQGVPLDPGTNFTAWHWNPHYGNCYTFNLGYSKSSTPAPADTKDNYVIKRGGSSGSGIRMSTQSGDQYGLYLLLNSDVYHYLSTTTQIGWRVVVHNQTDMPFPEESGVFVAPGTSTRIGITMNYIERLGVVSNWLYDAPYSDCLTSGDLIFDDPRNAYTNMLEVSYTKSACLKTCYQRQVLKNCSCFDFFYPNRGSAYGSGTSDYPPCSYANTTLWQCKSTIQVAYLNGELKCDCPSTCKSFSYDTTISTLRWPNPATSPLESTCAKIYDTLVARGNMTDQTCSNMSYLVSSAKKSRDGIPALASKIGKCVQMNNPQTNPSTDEWKADQYATFLIGGQFAEVFIFYKDFNFQSVVESQLLEFGDLLAYLGGILGLFFGFTFLTLFEYIQLLIDLVIFCIGAIANIIWKKSNRTTDIELHPFELHKNDQSKQRMPLPPSGSAVEDSEMRLMSHRYSHDVPSSAINGAFSSNGFPFKKFLDGDAEGKAKKF